MARRRRGGRSFLGRSDAFDGLHFAFERGGFGSAETNRERLSLVNYGPTAVLFNDVVRWAQVRNDRLILVDDSHRLANHVEFCAEEFGRFLAALK